MDFREHYVTSSDASQSIHYAVWTPDAPPVAVLQIVHGMEEYIMRYDAFARFLTARGWAVIGHDHLGHGKSGRWERGFFTEQSQGHNILISDIRIINDIARETWSGCPVFIFGHSMGSFFTRRYLAEHATSVDGAVICGSGWYASIATGTAYLAARIIGGIIGMHRKSRLLKAICSAPFLLAYRSEGTNAWLSRNRQNVMRYNADPLCGFGFTCGGYRDMYRNLLLVSRQHHYSQLRPMPLLVVSGADDPVGGASSVRRIARQYRRLGFPDVTELAVANARHEILFEDNAQETMERIAAWLSAKNAWKTGKKV